jgi:integrase
VLWSTVSPTDIIDQEAAASRWVFSDDAGEPLNPNQISYRFRLAVAASKLRAIPLHGLRHTHATILLSAGVPVHIVSARLGHANPTITMNVYAHCLPRAQQAAVAVLAGMGAQRVR